MKMAGLTIRGKRKYIKRISKHLKKEHPSTKKRIKLDIKRKVINPMNTRSDKELLQGHALTHYWWNNPKRTNWTKSEVKKEHTRLVKIMLRRGMNHNSPLK